MRRQIGIGLALTAASLALSLVLLEVVLRVGVLRAESFRSTRLETISRTNMKIPDLREPRNAIEPKGEAFRIVVVGDSFAWGDGVYTEDAFPFRLESQINQLSMSRDFEVINWSHPGWSTIHQMRSLIKEFDRLSPDLLVLSFVLNDPEPAQSRVREENWQTLETRIPEAGLSGFFFRHSRIFGLLSTGLENRRLRRAMNTYYHELFEGQTWEDCQWALRRIRTTAYERDIPMALVVFPLFQGQMDNTYPYLDLHAKVRATGDTLGIPVLDLFDTYRGVDGRRLATIPFTDAHPSELAHRLAAGAILEFLIEKSLVPPPSGPLGELPTEAEETS
jgi:hypothetical protein